MKLQDVSNNNNKIRLECQSLHLPLGWQMKFKIPTYVSTVAYAKTIPSNGHFSIGKESNDLADFARGP